jgi:hypothetical protein|tara:strand:+ start:178 stop:435 length:258 start_codon:yes stop_codon:yes gene_type:complete
MSYLNKRVEHSDRLEEIIAQVSKLGEEAASLMKDHFPRQYTRGEAYGAFTLGTSGNPYDTTLAKLHEEVIEELIEEDEAHPDFEH